MDEQCFYCANGHAKNQAGIFEGIKAGTICSQEDKLKLNVTHVCSGTRAG